MRDAWWVAVLLCGCAAPRERLGDPRAEIGAMLAASAVAWNGGDLAGFMRDYAHDSTLTYLSGGRARAESGELTFMASGAPATFAAAESILAATSAKVFRLGDAPGIGSLVKTVNQLLAGVHIATAAEAVALAAKAGADTRVVYEVISASAGDMASAGAARINASSGSARRTARPASGSTRSSQAVSACPASAVRNASINRPARDAIQTIAATTARP